MWKTMPFELDAEAQGRFHASVKPAANEVRLQLRKFVTVAALGTRRRCARSLSVHRCGCRSNFAVKTAGELDCSPH